MKLLNNLFYKVVLVKDYESALLVAKTNDLTSITPQLQIVYSGAFITKVGANSIQASESRLSLYYQIALLKKQQQEAESLKETIRSEQDLLSNFDLEAFRKF